MIKGSMSFTPLDTYDNGNEIDGTPGCPTVQLCGMYYRCSPAMSVYVASLAKAYDAKHGGEFPNYLQANSSSQPTLIALFDENQPDADYEFIVFKKGLKTDTWYASTVAF